DLRQGEDAVHELAARLDDAAVHEALRQRESSGNREDDGAGVVTGLNRDRAGIEGRDRALDLHPALVVDAAAFVFVTLGVVVVELDGRQGQGRIRDGRDDLHFAADFDARWQDEPVWQLNDRGDVVVRDGDARR